MRNKETEKLFNLAYTDAMTGVYNRAAYEEKVAKLRKSNARLNNIMIVIAEVSNIENIKDTFGNRMYEDAVKSLASCLTRTVGAKADVYRVNENEFICIAERDILSYISELRDLVSFENREKIYPFSVSLGYALFNPKKQKTIDDLIFYSDKKMNDIKNRKADK